MFLVQPSKINFRLIRENWMLKKFLCFPQIPLGSGHPLQDSQAVNNHLEPEHQSVSNTIESYTDDFGDVQNVILGSISNNLSYNSIS